MKDSKYYQWLFIVIFIIILAGFYRSYLSQISNLQIYPTEIHFHGLMLFLWFVLLLLQPYFIRVGKLKIHKRLGKLSYILVPLIILSIVGVSKMAFNRGLESGDSVQLLYSYFLFDYLAIIFFAGFYATAIIYRKNTSRHIKFMLAATLILFGPAVGRFSGLILGSSPLVFYIVYSYSFFVIILMWVIESISKKMIIWRNDFLVITACLTFFYLLDYHVGKSQIWLFIAEFIAESIY